MSKLKNSLFIGLASWGGILLAMLLFWASSLFGVDVVKTIVYSIGCISLLAGILGGVYGICLSVMMLINKAKFTSATMFALILNVSISVLIVFLLWLTIWGGV
jgi:hypothetical protein